MDDSDGREEALQVWVKTFSLTVLLPPRTASGHRLTRPKALRLLEHAGNQLRRGWGQKPIERHRIAADSFLFLNGERRFAELFNHDLSMAVGFDETAIAYHTGVDDSD